MPIQFLNPHWFHWELKSKTPLRSQALVLIRKLTYALKKDCKLFDMRYAKVSGFMFYKWKICFKSLKPFKARHSFRRHDLVIPQLASENVIYVHTATDALSIYLHIYIDRFRNRLLTLYCILREFEKGMCPTRQTVSPTLTLLNALLDGTFCLTPENIKFNIKFSSYTKLLQVRVNQIVLNTSKTNGFDARDQNISIQCNYKKKHISQKPSQAKK